MIALSIQNSKNICVSRRSILVFILFLAGCVHLDEAHRQACSQLVVMSRHVDSFFAEPRLLEEYQETRLILTAGSILRERSGLTFTGKNQVKLALPGLRDRWGLLIGGASEREEFDSEHIGDLQEGDYESYIRVFPKKQRPFDWDFDVGVKYNNGPQTFVRFKTQYNGNISISSFRAIQRMYWTNTYGLGEKTRFEIDQSVGAQSILREFAELEWSETSDGINLVWGVYLRSKLREDFGISYEWTHYGATHPWDYKYFDFTTRIRKGIFWSWLEFEIAPRLRFYRQHHVTYELSPLLEFKINLIFDTEHLR